MKNFFVKLFSNIYGLIGLLLIIGYLWLRLRERLPHELKFIPSLTYLIITIVMIVIYFSAIKNLYRPKNNWITKKVTIIQEHGYKSLSTFYDLLFEYLHKFINKKIVYTYLFYFMIRNKLKLFYFICFICPGLALSSAFFVDVVIFNYMYYLYKILFLVWIPILLRIFFYIMTHWGNDFNMYIRTIFFVNEEIDETGYPLFTLTKKYPELELDVSLNYDFWLCLSTEHKIFNSLIDEIKQESWVRYLNTVTYLNFFLLWLYTLYRIIENFLVYIYF